MMLRLGLLSILVVTGCKRDEPAAVVASPAVDQVTPQQRWRSRQSVALTQVTPPNVSVELSADGRTMEGRAATFDDVSELMRALNNIVSAPRGNARVVERQRDGGFRVEFLDGGQEVVELGGKVGFFFSDFELKSTESFDGGVHFTLQFGATEERGTVPQ